MTGKELQAWRQKAELSVRDIADIVSRSPRTVEGWERKKDESIPDFALALLQPKMDASIVLVEMDEETHARSLKKAKSAGFETIGEWMKELTKIVMS